jgi:CRP-like cAMP-binding protein
MQSWLGELLAPEALLRHLSFLLLVLAMALPTVAWLRVFALASGIVAIVSATLVFHDPVGLIWAIALVAVLAARIILQSLHAAEEALNPEERLFQQRVVPSLTGAQTRRLVKAGQWREVAAGTVLTRQGEIIRELCFVARGLVDIMVDGHKIGEVVSGTLIGELGLSTGEAAKATAVCASPVRYLAFETDRLFGLLDRNADLQDAIDLAIHRSLREKLLRQNFAAAHMRGAAP